MDGNMSQSAPRPASQPSPIAIVGMSCRLPGDVSTVEDLWTMLSRSRDGWRPIPEDRFNSTAYYHPNPQKKGCFNQKGGYFMNRDLSKFDAPFFQITEQEALAMDPQQRQLLECTYEALENAGISKEVVGGSNMGVFIGGANSDYRLGTLKDLNQVPMFDATGNHQSIQAGRISYYFDLRGPCFSVDTACSSGLYALHSAVQSIRSGESDSAIVAGCNLHLQPDDMVSMSMLGIFNENGKTYSFDHRAKSGFARGEGVGCLIIKPLEHALRDHDKIRSIIVSTGINQDGRTVGLSTPSGEAQEQLIRDVYARANISPLDTGFVEAHGTGTRTGDPIEAGAISRVFSNGRTKRNPLYMGSVKTNVGHLENASGIISIIKSALMLEKGFILPNVNFEKANDAIPLDEWNIKIPTSLRPWPKNKRYISVNNFGFGGSNAHVVLERPSFALKDLAHDTRDQAPRLFVLSAHDESAAKRVASQFGVFVEQHPEVFQKRLIRDIAYTLGERRTHMPWRIALPASSCDDLTVSLNSAIDALPKRASKPPKLAFVFTGQGAQWPQMGCELLETYPLFAKTVKTAGDHLMRLGADFSLVDELLKNKQESNVNKAHISQPICTAVQLGLISLLSSFGIRPSVVMGHSSGEIAAAYSIGAISLEDAMSAAYYRGHYASKMAANNPGLRGAMLAVGAGPFEVKSIIKKLGLRNAVNVACENSPNSITASGDEDAVDALAAELESRGLFNRKLRVDVAYHSSHMQLVADDYLSSIISMPAVDTEGIEFYSSLLGAKLDSTAMLGASYWVDNLTKPVLFSSALRKLYQDTKPDVIVEVGPHSALEGPIKQILKDISQQAAADTKYIPSLLRNQDGVTAAIQLAGKLFVHGHAINFASVNRTNVGLVPNLVTDFSPYPWSDNKYWFESRASKQHREKPFARHDLLGVLEDAYNDTEPTWRNMLSSNDVPWLRDHRMQSLVTFPLAGYMCMIVEAASQRARLRGIAPDTIAGYRFREVQVSKALILDDGAQYETLVSLRPYAEGTKSYSNDWDEFKISSWTSSRGWLEHCRGLVGVKTISGSNPISQALLQGATARRTKADKVANEQVSLESFYMELDAMGAGYSSTFTLKPSDGLKVGEEYCSSQVTIPDTASVMPSTYETPSLVPASFMDLFFQLTFPILGAGRGKMPSLFMPSFIKEMEINSRVPNQTGEQVHVVVNGRPNALSPGPVDFFIDAWHPSQAEPVVKLTGFRMTPITNDAGEGLVPRSLCYKVIWEPFGSETDSSAKNSVESNSHSSLDGHNGSTSNGHAVSSNDWHGELAHLNSSASKGSNGINGHANGKNGTNGQRGTRRHTSGLATATNGHSNGVNAHAKGANGHTNGVNGRSNGVNGNSKDGNGHAYGMNGHSNGVNSHPKTINGTNGSSDGANGHSNGTNGNSNGANGKTKNGTNHHVENGVHNEYASPAIADLDGASIVLISEKGEKNPLVSELANLIELRTGTMPCVSSFRRLVISPSSNYIFLSELDAPVLYNMSSKTFERVQKLLLTSTSVLWVTAGAYRFAERPENNIAQGLLRTVRSEASKPVAMLDMDPGSQLHISDRAELVLQSLKASLLVPEDGSPVDYEFAEEDGRLVVPRVVEEDDMNLALFRETQTCPAYLQDFQQPGRRLKIAVGTLGALDSLYWKDEAETPLAVGEVEIKVAATGMNFKDVVIAMGQVASPYLGVECSGTIARVGPKVKSVKVGDRVCAMSEGAYGTYARCLATSVVIIPKRMPFETAASIPVVYCTAYYGLMELARIEPGEKILIHAASGGVGQAAIQLSKMIGADIYATVGSVEKKEHIMKTYGIPENHIFYSRDTSFGPALREATGGSGVDVIINSLAGDLLRETWECLAPFGRFIEIGKRDITSNTRLEMSKFEQNCTFSSVDLTLVAAQRPRVMNRVFTAVMRLMAKKTVTPIGPITVVRISEVETALRKLQSGKTSGKVVVDHLALGQVKVTHSVVLTEPLRDDSTYLIIGGTGGLGRSMAKRMIQRGARHIVLLSRSGNVTPALENLIQYGLAEGASIYIKSCDVADAAQVTGFVNELHFLPPIRGVVHAAMVLRDVLFEKMTFRQYDEVVRSKILGAWNFHHALWNTPLDFFVMLSSVAGIVGNRGQAAYAAANTFLDAFTLHRRRQGLAASSLNLTAVEGVGYLAENTAKQSQVLKTLSGSTMDESEVLALVDAAIDGGVGTLCHDQCVTGLDFESPSSLPYYASDGKFSHLRKAALAKATDVGGPSTSNLLLSQKIRQAQDMAEAQSLVAIGLRDKLGAILMLPTEVMEAQQATTSITAFGLDSLNAIELRNWIGKELQAHLQVLELLTSGGLNDLAALVLRKTRIEGAWTVKE